MYNLTVGVGEAPDEPPHMDYARYIADHHALPIQTPDPTQRISNEAHQPPAYYILGALLTGWIESGDFYRLVAIDASGQRFADDRVTLTNLEVLP